MSKTRPLFSSEIVSRGVSTLRMTHPVSHNKPSAPVSAALSIRAGLFLAGALAIVLLLLVLTGSLQNIWVQVVTLGVVQGLTEFLPISSTAHLLIISNLLHFEGGIGGTFQIFIQSGTVVAVVAFYARDLIEQARDLPTRAEVRCFWLGIIIAFLPAALVGVVLRDWIKAVLFDAPIPIACSLIVGGIIFIFLERLPQRAAPVEAITRISFKQALGIGLAQVTAFIPGVSRSGASIVGGLLVGLDRRTATAFSFYLSIPTLGAATLADLLTNLDHITSADYARLLVGTLVAGVVGWFSIGWLLRYVSTNNFIPFGIYRIAAGLLILLLVALGQL